MGIAFNRHLSEGVYSNSLPRISVFFIAMETEVWKPVVGYEGMYEVSNLGKIKSLLDRHRKERIFKPASDRVGYLYCGIRKN